MNLSDLRPPKGQKQKKQRIGQGMGTGRGKYSGRGAKGARSISGYSIMRGFEGGQMPLHRRLPKRGFTNIFKKEYAIVNVGRLEQLEGSAFDPGRLLELGVIKKLGAGLKVLGSGDLTRKIEVQAHVFSKSALEKIQKAGGSWTSHRERVSANEPTEVGPEVGKDEVFRHHRQYVPDSGPAEAHLLHAGVIGRLPVRRAHPDAGNRCQPAGGVLPAEFRIAVRLHRSVQRRHVPPADHLRPGHHALHHGVHHSAIAAPWWFRRSKNCRRKANWAAARSPSGPAISPSSWRWCNPSVSP